MLESIKLAVVMAIALSFCSPCSSGFVEESIDFQTKDSERTYPNDWTHRPFGELFTSLSCVYCMSYADPAMEEVIHDGEMDETNPFNVVVFHQTNGGAGDDPFHTQDSRSRMRDHYGQTGTPNAQFDGNYRYVGGGGESNYQDYTTALSESGQREGEGNDEPFKIVDLDIYSEFIGSESEGEAGQFKLSVDVTYFGQTGGDDGVPTEPDDILGESPDLNGELIVFMVEDGVPAYSSQLEEIWNNRMVFREYGIESEVFTLAQDESTTFSAVWKVPTTQLDGDGVDGDIKIPINPGRIIPIAVVFDTDDTDSGNDQDSNGDDTYPTPRSIQSATPQSTKYDNPERDVPEITTKTEKYLDEGAEVQAQFDAEEGIGASFVVYNYESSNYTGEWFTDEMKIEGEEVCDENGVCYAYSGATGTSVIPYSGDSEIYYQVIFSDGNKTSDRTDVLVFVGADGGTPPSEERELPMMLIGIGALVLAALSGFAYWARKPASG
ncbi:MAG: hypothetical protein ACJZ37_01550 [Candidatus Poseidoniales archaeon]|tara:strand:+ start:727 stop:2208 length:1482 start_codon:yes stop_codon:yes gene_type:complete